MSGELKSCPFCGGEAHVHEKLKPGSETRWTYAACSICDARGPEVAGSSTQYAGRNKGEDTAITAWNTRADASRQDRPSPEAQVLVPAEVVKELLHHLSDPRTTLWDDHRSHWLLQLKAAQDRPDPTGEVGERDPTAVAGQLEQRAHETPDEYHYHAVLDDRAAALLRTQAAEITRLEGANRRLARLGRAMERERDEALNSWEAAEARATAAEKERDEWKEKAGFLWTAPDVDAWGCAAERAGVLIRDKANGVFRRAVRAEEAQAATEAKLAEVVEHLRLIRRTSEMSAGIMRSPERTGGWAGSERTARQFDRLAEDARRAEAALATLEGARR